MKELNLDIFKQYHQKWALLTAGSEQSFNTMTISWGGMGTLWNRPVVTVYVKPVRYTYAFMEANEFFTVSFFPEDYKRDLGILGSKSGRDCNKLGLTRLTPYAAENGIMFREAELTLVCRKLYSQDMDIERIPDFAIESFYELEAPHRMYIGEVIAIADKRG